MAFTGAFAEGGAGADSFIYAGPCSGGVLADAVHGAHHRHCCARPAGRH